MKITQIRISKVRKMFLILGLELSSVFFGYTWKYLKNTPNDKISI